MRFNLALLHYLYNLGFGPYDQSQYPGSNLNSLFQTVRRGDSYMCTATILKHMFIDNNEIIIYEDFMYKTSFLGVHIENSYF